MFVLGVMVGRETAPVTFDTRGVQARLEAIAREYGQQGETEQKVDLNFYDALNNPVRHEVKGRVKKNSEILPRPEPLLVSDGKANAGPDEVPVKLSKKHESLNRELLAEFKKKAGRMKKVPEAGPVVKAAQNIQIASKEKKTLKAKDNARNVQKTTPPASAPEKTGSYTIQVAAYKAFKDAVSQMAALEKKGIDAYRIKGEKDGATWYRVRTGAFSDYQAAAARLQELKQAKVNGMIIKKE